MIHLLKSKIDELNNEDNFGINNLDKVLGAGIFIVRDDARSISPIQPEYVKAVSILFHW